MPLGANKATLFGSSGVVTATSVLLATGVASSSASLEFTIPATYKQIVFGFYNIAPATDNVEFNFQVSTDGGSSYGMTMTTTYFYAFHNEANTDASLAYNSAMDLSQSTSYQPIGGNLGSDADQSLAGELHLFNPSSTTYVKHWYLKISNYRKDDMEFNGFAAGYVNSTSDVDAINFKMASGNIASGTIKMWGVL
jgi:hypothetical protein